MAAILSLPHLVDLSIGTPEVGAVNFTALHQLLHSIVDRLNISELNPDIDKAFPAQGTTTTTTATVAATKWKALEALESKVASIEHNLEVFYPKLPNAKEMSELVTSDRPIADFWQFLSLTKQIEANASGLQAAMDLIQEIFNQLKTFQNTLHELKAKSLTADDMTESNNRIGSLMSKVQGLEFEVEHMGVVKEFIGEDHFSVHKPQVDSNYELPQPIAAQLVKDPVPSKVQPIMVDETFVTSTSSLVSKVEAAVQRNDTNTKHMMQVLTVPKVSDIVDQLNYLQATVDKYPQESEIVTWTELEGALNGTRNVISPLNKSTSRPTAGEEKEKKEFVNMAASPIAGVGAASSRAPAVTDAASSAGPILMDATTSLLSTAALTSGPITAAAAPSPKTAAAGYSSGSAVEAAAQSSMSTMADAASSPVPMVEDAAPSPGPTEDCVNLLEKLGSADQRINHLTDKVEQLNELVKNTKQPIKEDLSQLPEDVMKQLNQLEKLATKASEIDDLKAKLYDLEVLLSDIPEACDERLPPLGDKSRLSLETLQTHQRLSESSTAAQRDVTSQVRMAELSSPGAAVHGALPRRLASLTPLKTESLNGKRALRLKKKISKHGLDKSVIVQTQSLSAAEDGVMAESGKSAMGAETDNSIAADGREEQAISQPTDGQVSLESKMAITGSALKKSPRAVVNKLHQHAQQTEGEQRDSDQRNSEWRDNEQRGRGQKEIEQMDRGQMDRGQIERGQIERGQMDRGQIERGQIERGQMDRGQMDRGQMDRGQMDRGQMDRGQMDRGQMDRGQMDRGQRERGQMHRGQTDRGQMDSGPYHVNYQPQREPETEQNDVPEVDSPLKYSQPRDNFLKGKRPAMFAAGGVLRPQKDSVETGYDVAQASSPQLVRPFSDSPTHSIGTTSSTVLNSHSFTQSQPLADDSEVDRVSSVVEDDGQQLQLDSRKNMRMVSETPRHADKGKLSARHGNWKSDKMNSAAKHDNVKTNPAPNHGPAPDKPGSKAVTHGAGSSAMSLVKSTDQAHDTTSAAEVSKASESLGRFNHTLREVVHKDYMPEIKRLQIRVDRLENRPAYQAQVEDNHLSSTSMETGRFRNFVDKLDSLKEETNRHVKQMDNQLRSVLDQGPGDDALRRTQIAIGDLQAQLTTLRALTLQMKMENDYKTAMINEMKQDFARLDEEKVDSNTLATELDHKADIIALQSKSDKSALDTLTFDLQRLIDDLLGKLVSLEDAWRKVHMKLESDVEMKANDDNLMQLKQAVEDKMRKLHQQLKKQQKLLSPTADEAALLRRKLPFNCLSCDKPVAGYQYCVGDNVKLSKLGPHTVHYSQSEIEQLQKQVISPRSTGGECISLSHLKKRNLKAYMVQLSQDQQAKVFITRSKHRSVIPGVADLYAKPRACGGKHTITQHKLQGQIIVPGKNQSLRDIFMGEEFVAAGVLNQQEQDIDGADGRPYRSRVNTIEIDRELTAAMLANKDPLLPMMEEISQTRPLSSRDSLNKNKATSRSHAKSARKRNLRSESTSSVEVGGQRGKTLISKDIKRNK